MEEAFKMKGMKNPQINSSTLTRGSKIHQKKSSRNKLRSQVWLRWLILPPKIKVDKEVKMQVWQKVWAWWRIHLKKKRNNLWLFIQVTKLLSFIHYSFDAIFYAFGRHQLSNMFRSYYRFQSGYLRSYFLQLMFIGMALEKKSKLEKS